MQTHAGVDVRAKYVLGAEVRSKNALGVDVRSKYVSGGVDVHAKYMFKVLTCAQKQKN